MEIVIKSGIALYKFSSLKDATKALFRWQNDGLAEEKEIADFIIQLFNQIPETLYNDIVDSY
jgi:hypothetical protein